MKHEIYVVAGLEYVERNENNTAWVPLTERKALSLITTKINNKENSNYKKGKGKSDTAKRAVSVSQGYAGAFDDHGRSANTSQEQRIPEGTFWMADSKHSNDVANKLQLLQQAIDSEEVLHFLEQRCKKQKTISKAMANEEAIIKQSTEAAEESKKGSKERKNAERAQNKAMNRYAAFYEKYDPSIPTINGAAQVFLSENDTNKGNASPILI